MTKVEQLEHEVRALSSEELASFREWFVAFDAADWDRQFEVDATIRPRQRRTKCRLERVCRVSRTANRWW